MLWALLGLAVFNTIVLAFVVMRSLALTNQLANLEKNVDKTDKTVRDEIYKNREELGRNFQSFNENIAGHLESFTKQLNTLTQMNEQKLEKVREVLENRLQTLQDDNSKKLEQMRATVDEKLHATLEKRLGDSFKIVSDLLGKVHHGLGEMQNLATGVGDLKKVLSNVKTRGTLGEVQLGSILEQIFTPEQYEKNVITKRSVRSADRVEFAIKLPGPDGQGLFIPIDAKFPVEDFERLQDAQEAGNIQLIEQAASALEMQFKKEAKSIREKYIDPPFTTDFAVLFVPMEGLYAEVLRRPGLFNHLRQEYSVVVTGPTTISAYLSSLQMGFRTLAVQKRASEVWKLLGTVKTEFNKFGQILESTHKKLQEASNTIDMAARKTRTIERTLRDVQELPSAASDASDPLLEHQLE